MEFKLVRKSLQYLLLLPLFDRNGRADVLPEVFRAFLRTTCLAVQPYVPEVR